MNAQRKTFDGDKMRIGKFAESNQLSIDTIRHYMDLGLIIPEKHGGQYFFNGKCQRDLTNIRDLKRMGFTLNEIKAILMFNRLGKLTPYQEDEYYRTFFMNKHQNIKKEIKELMDMKNRLQEFFSRKRAIDEKLGILHYFLWVNLYPCLVHLSIALR